MKKLLITLMLISPFSFADWGDVYYCQMTSNSGVTNSGKRTEYTLEKFQFKLDKTKNAMVFGGSGYFMNKVYKITPRGLTVQTRAELWRAYGSHSWLFYNLGRFVHSYVALDASTVTADCDKF